MRSARAVDPLASGTPQTQHDLIGPTVTPQHGSVRYRGAGSELATPDGSLAFDSVGRVLSPEASSFSLAGSGDFMTSSGDFGEHSRRHEPSGATAAGARRAGQSAARGTYELRRARAAPQRRAATAGRQRPGSRGQGNSRRRSSGGGAVGRRDDAARPATAPGVVSGTAAPATNNDEQTRRARRRAKSQRVARYVAGAPRGGVTGGIAALLSSSGANRAGQPADTLQVVGMPSPRLAEPRDDHSHGGGAAANGVDMHASVRDQLEGGRDPREDGVSPALSPDRAHGPSSGKDSKGDDSKEADTAAAPGSATGAEAGSTAGASSAGGSHVPGKKRVRPQSAPGARDSAVASAAERIALPAPGIHTSGDRGDRDAVTGEAAALARAAADSTQKAREVRVSTGQGRALKFRQEAGRRSDGDDYAIPDGAEHFYPAPVAKTRPNSAMARPNGGGSGLGGQRQPLVVTAVAVVDGREKARRKGGDVINTSGSFTMALDPKSYRGDGTSPTSPKSEGSRPSPTRGSPLMLVHRVPHADGDDHIGDLVSADASLSTTGVEDTGQWEVAQAPVVATQQRRAAAAPENQRPAVRDSKQQARSSAAQSAKGGQGMPAPVTGTAYPVAGSGRGRAEQASTPPGIVHVSVVWHRGDDTGHPPHEPPAAQRPAAHSSRRPVIRAPGGGARGPLPANVLGDEAPAADDASAAPGLHLSPTAAPLSTPPPRRKSASDRGGGTGKGGAGTGRPTIGDLGPSDSMDSRQPAGLNGNSRTLSPQHDVGGVSVLQSLDETGTGGVDGISTVGTHVGDGEAPLPRAPSSGSLARSVGGRALGRLAPRPKPGSQRPASAPASRARGRGALNAEFPALLTTSETREGRVVGTNELTGAAAEEALLLYATQDTPAAQKSQPQQQQQRRPVTAEGTSRRTRRRSGAATAEEAGRVVGELAQRMGLPTSRLAERAENGQIQIARTRALLQSTPRTVGTTVGMTPARTGEVLRTAARPVSPALGGGMHMQRGQLLGAGRLYKGAVSAAKQPAEAAHTSAAMVTARSTKSTPAYSAPASPRTSIVADGEGLDVDEADEVLATDALRGRRLSTARSVRTNTSRETPRVSPRVSPRKTPRPASSGAARERVESATPRPGDTERTSPTVEIARYQREVERGRVADELAVAASPVRLPPELARRASPTPREGYARNAGAGAHAASMETPATLYDLNVDATVESFQVANPFDVSVVRHNAHPLPDVGGRYSTEALGLRTKPITPNRRITASSAYEAALRHELKKLAQELSDVTPETTDEQRATIEATLQHTFAEGMPLPASIEDPLVAAVVGTTGAPPSGGSPGSRSEGDATSWGADDAGRARERIEVDDARTASPEQVPARRRRRPRTAPTQVGFRRGPTQTTTVFGHPRSTRPPRAEQTQRRSTSPSARPTLVVAREEVQHEAERHGAAAALASNSPPPGSASATFATSSAADERSSAPHSSASGAAEATAATHAADAGPSTLRVEPPGQAAPWLDQPSPPRPTTAPARHEGVAAYYSVQPIEMDAGDDDFVVVGSSAKPVDMHPKVRERLDAARERRQQLRGAVQATAYEEMVKKAEAEAMAAASAKPKPHARPTSAQSSASTNRDGTPKYGRRARGRAVPSKAPAGVSKSPRAAGSDLSIPTVTPPFDPGKIAIRDGWGKPEREPPRKSSRNIMPKWEDDGEGGDGAEAPRPRTAPHGSVPVATVHTAPATAPNAWVAKGHRAARPGSKPAGANVGGVSRGKGGGEALTSPRWEASVSPRPSSAPAKRPLRRRDSAQAASGGGGRRGGGQERGRSSASSPRVARAAFYSVPASPAGLGTGLAAVQLPLPHSSATVVLAPEVATRVQLKLTPKPSGAPVKREKPQVRARVRAEVVEERAQELSGVYMATGEGDAEPLSVVATSPRNAEPTSPQSPHLGPESPQMGPAASPNSAVTPASPRSYGGDDVRAGARGGGQQPLAGGPERVVVRSAKVSRAVRPMSGNSSVRRPWDASAGDADSDAPMDDRTE